MMTCARNVLETKKKKKKFMHILSDICTCARSVLETNKKEKKKTIHAYT